MAVIPVVMPVLDDAPLLVACLDALAHQRRPASHAIPAATAAWVAAATGDILDRLNADSCAAPP